MEILNRKTISNVARVFFTLSYGFEELKSRDTIGGKLKELAVQAKRIKGRWRIYGRIDRTCTVGRVEFEGTCSFKDKLSLDNAKLFQASS